MTPDEHEFYTDLFTRDPWWSTPYPNVDEAKRWAAMCPYVASITCSLADEGRRPRILDVGCGRGWLTNFLSVFGDCEGIDPIAPPVAMAQQRYRDIPFRVGTLRDVLEAPDFRPYDLIVASEVIEHITAKDQFVQQLQACLNPHGHVILTTPRAECYENWRRARIGGDGQPVEEWLTERQLRTLFRQHGFIVRRRNRVYLPLPELSLLQKIAGNPRLRRMLDRFHLAALIGGLEFMCGFYQVWWFQTGSG